MGRHRREFLAALGVSGAAGIAGCSMLGGNDSGAEGSDTPIQKESLVLATTTSTFDTGLLDKLHSAFEARFGIQVETIARGTGASLRAARNGDADAVLVHARELEDEFLQDGYGLNRRDVMFNDYVVVGPEDDPAGIESLDSPTKAFTTIADTEEQFISRGDNSGTYVKEQQLWDESDTSPGSRWYHLIGQGMGAALQQASQTDAYTLADRGTVVVTQEDHNLAIHVEGPVEGGPAALKNPYGVMAVNPARHGRVNYQAATAYIGFLTSPRGQEIIGSYTVNGTQLFVPNALDETPDLEQYVPEASPMDRAEG